MLNSSWLMTRLAEKSSEVQASMVKKRRLDIERNRQVEDPSMGLVRGRRLRAYLESEHVSAGSASIRRLICQ